MSPADATLQAGTSPPGPDGHAGDLCEWRPGNAGTTQVLACLVETYRPRQLRPRTCSPHRARRLLIWRGTLSPFCPPPRRRRVSKDVTRCTQRWRSWCLEGDIACSVEGPLSRLAGYRRMATHTTGYRDSAAAEAVAGHVMPTSWPLHRKRADQLATKANSVGPVRTVARLPA